MDEQREGTWVLGCLEKPGWVISFPGAFFLLSQGDRKKRTRRSRGRREGEGGGGGGVVSREKTEDPATEVQTTGKSGPKGGGPRTDAGRQMDGS